jgi:hypothetical protein
VRLIRAYEESLGAMCPHCLHVPPRLVAERLRDRPRIHPPVDPQNFLATRATSVALCAETRQLIQELAELRQAATRLIAETKAVLSRAEIVSTQSWADLSNDEMTATIADEIAKVSSWSVSFEDVVLAERRCVKEYFPAVDESLLRLLVDSRYERAF